METAIALSGTEVTLTIPFSQLTRVIRVLNIAARNADMLLLDPYEQSIAAEVASDFTTQAIAFLQPGRVSHSTGRA